MKKTLFPMYSPHAKARSALQRAHNAGIADHAHRVQYENDLIPKYATIERYSLDGSLAIVPCLKLLMIMESVGGRSFGGLRRCGNTLNRRPCLAKTLAPSTFPMGFTCLEERMPRSSAEP
jgi:hypothetical protein